MVSFGKESLINIKKKDDLSHRSFLGCGCFGYFSFSFSFKKITHYALSIQGI